MKTHNKLILILALFCFILCTSFAKSQDDEIDISEVSNNDNQPITKKEESPETEDTAVNDNKNKDDSSLNDSTKVKVKLPEIVVVQPIRRQGNSAAIINVAPCGGIEKGLANTIANVGNKIYAIWEIRNPISNGNCTVAMSPAMEENFATLKPITKGTVYDDEFSFPCGRQIGFEFQEFELPVDYACDHCTFQINWKTHLGNLYTCSDMLILGNKSKIIYNLHTNSFI
jgi:hypothetical protein